MKKVLLKIDGMTCSACSSGLEKYLNKQNGIKEAVVNLVMNNASVEYDDTKLTLEQVEKFVEKAGFTSLGIDNFEKDEKKKSNEKYKLIGITIISLLVLYISMSHMVGLPVIPFLHMLNHPINFAVALFILTTIVLVMGRDILKNGYKNLIHKTPNMDTLVTIGVLASYIYSIYGTIQILKGQKDYVENLYYESAAIVIFFIKIGKFVENKNKDKTKEAIQKLVKITPESATIKVNGKETKHSYKLKLNDEIEIFVPEAKEINLKAQDIPLNVIYEDNDIIVINKPKGMVVHPANGNPDGTLVNAVMNKCKDSLSGIGGEIRPGIVHRLDKDTSGAIIVAKNDKAHIALSEQLKNHEVKKTYLALVRGIIKENEATINMPIARSKKDRKKMDVDKDGKEAITHFKVLGRYKNKYTLLQINLETGRTHQIRVHLSHIGYPIIGDEVYSNGKNEWNVSGQCLHAWKLEFIHPITGKKISLEAEIPEYLKNIIKELEEEK